MNFLHTDFQGGPNETVVVTLDGQANVMLLDEQSFQNYRRGGSFRYIGGLAKRSPVRLTPPHHARWHVVVDLGGYGGTVRAGVRILHREGVSI